MVFISIGAGRIGAAGAACRGGSPAQADLVRLLRADTVRQESVAGAGGLTSMTGVLQGPSHPQSMPQCAPLMARFSHLAERRGERGCRQPGQSRLAAGGRAAGARGLKLLWKSDKHSVVSEKTCVAGARAKAGAGMVRGRLAPPRKLHPEPNSPGMREPG